MTTGLPGRAVRPGNPAGQPGSSVAGFTPGTTLGRWQLIFPRLIGKQSMVNSSHEFFVWRVDRMTSWPGSPCRSYEWSASMLNIRSELQTVQATCMKTQEISYESINILSLPLLKTKHLTDLRVWDEVARRNVSTCHTWLSWHSTYNTHVASTRRGAGETSPFHFTSL